MSVLTTAFKPGGVYEFRYHKGSSPGTMRKVFVEEINTFVRSIKAIDLDKQEFRNFKLDSIDSVRELKYTYITRPALMSGVGSVHDINRLNAIAKVVYENENIVVTPSKEGEATFKAILVPKKQPTATNRSMVEMKNAKGEVLFYDTNNTVRIFGSSGLLITTKNNLRPEDFPAELSAFLAR